MSGIGQSMANEEVQGWTSTLRTEGYTIIPDMVSPHIIAALSADLAPIFDHTPFCEGDFYGPYTKRFGSLLRRSPHAEALVRHPLILSIAQEVLGPACDCIQLNLTQAIAIHPGAPRQFPHRDEDMWQGEKGHHEYLLNVIWPLTPFTADNGATRIHPAAHYGTGDEVDGVPGDEAVAISAVCEPGAAICFPGSTLHGAGTNRSGSVRQAIIVSYCLGWLKPYENQWLTYPPHVARHFSPELAALVGYRQHRPNLGNYEGQCPSILLRVGVPEHVGARDALRPEQTGMIADFAAQQRIKISGTSEPNSYGAASTR